MSEDEEFVGHGEYARILRYCLEHGDRKPLISALSTLDPCPGEVAKLAAEYISGKIKLPNHKPKNFNLLVMALPGAKVLALIESGLNPKAAKADVAKELCCSKRTVEASLAFCKRRNITPGKNLIPKITAD